MVLVVVVLVVVPPVLKVCPSKKYPAANARNETQAPSAGRADHLGWILVVAVTANRTATGAREELEGSGSPIVLVAHLRRASIST